LATGATIGSIFRDLCSIFRFSALAAPSVAVAEPCVHPPYCCCYCCCCYFLYTTTTKNDDKHHHGGRIRSDPTNGQFHPPGGARKGQRNSRQGTNDRGSSWSRQWIFFSRRKMWRKGLDDGVDGWCRKQRGLWLAYCPLSGGFYLVSPRLTSAASVVCSRYY